MTAQVLKQLPAAYAALLLEIMQCTILLSALCRCTFARRVAAAATELKKGQRRLSPNKTGAQQYLKLEEQQDYLSWDCIAQQCVSVSTTRLCCCAGYTSWGQLQTGF